jgi:hypothetical protein
MSAEKFPASLIRDFSIFRLAIIKDERNREMDIFLIDIPVTRLIDILRPHN